MKEKIFKRSIAINRNRNIVKRDRFICDYGIEYIWSIKLKDYGRYEHGIFIDYNTFNSCFFKHYLKDKQNSIIKDLIQYIHKTGKWA